MSARCYWHAQFWLDLACQQQQAGTFFFFFFTVRARHKVVQHIGCDISHPIVHLLSGIESHHIAFSNRFSSTFCSLVSILFLRNLLLAGSQQSRLLFELPVIWQLWFIVPFSVNHFFLCLSFQYFCLGVSAHCYWHAKFELYLTCQQQQAGTFLFLFSLVLFDHFFAGISPPPIFNVIFLWIFPFGYFFVWACQPAAIDMLSLD